MALPEITLPRGFPYFLAANHGFGLVWAFVSIPRVTGLTRSRRVRRRNLRIQDVALVLNETEAAQFVSWFERDLRVGSLPFSAQIMTADGRPLWWGCEWVAPPSHTAMHLGRWRIEGQVRISGDPPTIDGPVRSSFVSSPRITLQGVARPSVEKNFGAEISVGMIGVIAPPDAREFAAEITIGIT